MEIEGLDYNTQREKIRLKAYGRSIQQLVEACMALPTKQERQKAAESIVATMSRVVQSQHSKKERMPVLWYHLALMSDFKLDIDYPVDIVHEDKMAVKPEHLGYAPKQRIHVRHYGRLLQGFLHELREMPPGEERDALAVMTAAQMKRSLMEWGNGSISNERVLADLTRLTDGRIRLHANEVDLDAVESDMMRDMGSMVRKSKGKKKKK